MQQLCQAAGHKRRQRTDASSVIAVLGQHFVPLHMGGMLHRWLHTVHTRLGTETNVCSKCTTGDPYVNNLINCEVALYVINQTHLLRQEGQQRWQLRLAGALEDAVLG
jgi:hypothetical protein